MNIFEKIKEKLNSKKMNRLIDMLDEREQELIEQIGITEKIKRENERLKIELQYAEYFLEEERNKNGGHSIY